MAGSVSLTINPLTLNPGDEGQLQYSVNPAGTQLSWSSSNPRVADVDDNGYVTTIVSLSQTTNVTITATAADGSSAQTTVTVLGSGGGSSSGQTGDNTHRRQGVGADVVAHHDRIHRVVKLLEQVAQQQRQREQQQLLPDDALGHQSLVLPHLDPSFSSKSLSPWGSSFYRPGKAFSYSRLKCHICEK